MTMFVQPIDYFLAAWFVLAGLRVGLKINIH